MRRWTVVVGVFGVVCLIVGAVVYRTTTSTSGASTERPPAAPTTTTAPTVVAAAGADPATTDVAPTGAAAAEVAASGVEMPTDPSGARTISTTDGARQSAVDFVSTVRQRLVYMTDTSARAVLEAWAAPGAVPTLVESELAQAAGIRAALSADGGEVWWLVTPLATRVDAVDGDRARVSVWLASIAASSPDPSVSSAGMQPMVRFQTDSIEMVWSDSGWQVWSITSSDGPTPMTAPSAQVATVDIFVAALDGFGPIRSHQ